ncbi:hypothetical protein MHYP_G00253380 [Metynnis hypsauchen]
MSDPGKSSASASSATNTTATAAPAPGSDTYKGWLFKWTNYLKGYQRRWFVLSNGLLSYYSPHLPYQQQQHPPHSVSSAVTARHLLELSDKSVPP